LADAYYNRGISKYNLKDFYGAISDFTKAIELDPNLADAYEYRSISKELLGDLNGACEDAKKAISLGDETSVKWVAGNCN
jgi:tetratricopeptide (TPR) repeat protein